MSIIYLNGEYLPQEKATVSVMDRGFLFGDGVYEVVPVFNHSLLGIKEHLDRLNNSLHAIHMTPTLNEPQWKAIFKELLERNHIDDGNVNIYLQITRGAETSRQHAIPYDIQPTILAFCIPVKHSLKAKTKTGFHAITLADTRRRNCHIKAITLLSNILLYEEARKVDALEAILLRDGLVMEGTSSNVFVVSDGEILTPPLSNDILGGITRDLVLKLAKQHDIPTQEINITENRLRLADEIWVTASTKEICPIVTLDDNPVGTGKVGPIWQKINDYYEAYKGNQHD